ncbi:MAG: YfdX family protein [Burkholderiaceae bacterium]
MFTKTLRPSPLMMAMALSASALAFPSFSQAASSSTTAPVTSVKATAPMTKAAKRANPERLAMKLSEDGFNTMRDIRMARIAIFEGDTQNATNFVAQANQSLNAVDKAAAKETAQVKDDLLPIDGQIVVADNFIDTPAKRQHIGKANEHLKKGQPEMAQDELRLAEVDASFSRVLMPVDATRRHLNAAETLLKSDRFYEANLALKAAEDGLLVDTVAMSDLPATTAAQ